MVLPLGWRLHPVEDNVHSPMFGQRSEHHQLPCLLLSWWAQLIFSRWQENKQLISNFQEFLDSRAFGLFYCYESIFLIYLKIQISNKHKSK